MYSMRSPSRDRGGPPPVPEIDEEVRELARKTFEVLAWWTCLGFRDLGWFGVWGLGFGVWGLGFGVWDLGSGV